MLLIVLFLLGNQFPYVQQRETVQNPLLVEATYNRYIVVRDMKSVTHRDLQNTPIVPSQYRDRYNEDTVYVYIGESFQRDTVSIHRQDSLLFTKVVTTDPVLGCAATCRFSRDKQENYIIVQLNSRKSEPIYIDPDLYFVLIDYDKEQDLLKVEMTNRVIIFK